MPARRTVLGAGFAAATAALTGCGAGRSASWGTPPSQAPTDSSAFGQTLSSPAPPTGTPRPTLTGYPVELRDTLTRYLSPTPENPKHPGYAGAVVLVAVNGTVTVHTAVGHALRYGAGPVELPPAQRVGMRPDSIFDLASITKVYTAILVLQQVERGLIDLARPVIEYLPGFDGPGKAAITVPMLLAHTSGLPVGPKVTGLPGPTERRAAVLATPLVAGAVPGTVFRYSSTGLMVLGQLVESVTGQPLDQALRTGITGPLGLSTTGFNPLTWLPSADRANRLVATDARTSRGLLRGVVHDDVANIMGGIAGHAGIFSTAADVAVIGQLLLNGGAYGGKRILGAATVRRMLVNANPGLPAVDTERPDRTSTHGWGVELDQPWFMGRLASPRTFGHTGFTGTSLLVDPGRRLVLVLLTNRAHPNWTWANPDQPRVAVANLIARAVSPG
ncbi:MAG TPA: serine hydrolase domain-containing protein [Micromonosporaceae bacterium]|nr:serine hydrolase domain-containing protein [Micromonosporaceae bacterium]